VAEWEEERQRHFLIAYDDAVRLGGYSETYDLRIVEVGKEEQSQSTTCSMEP
jgi:hypothetical protein